MVWDLRNRVDVVWDLQKQSGCGLGLKKQSGCGVGLTETEWMWCGTYRNRVDVYNIQNLASLEQAFVLGWSFPTPTTVSSPLNINLCY